MEGLDSKAEAAIITPPRPQALESNLITSFDAVPMPHLELPSANVSVGLVQLLNTEEMDPAASGPNTSITSMSSHPQAVHNVDPGDDVDLVADILAASSPKAHSVSPGRLHKTHSVTASPPAASGTSSSPLQAKPKQRLNQPADQLPHTFRQLSF